MEIKLLTKSKEETMELGKVLAKHAIPGLVVTLTGDLGAGKTTFVKGMALGLGIDEKVTSPTFNILKCYFHKPLDLYHIDAYRLESGNKDIGLEEFIEGDGVTLIEWPKFIEEMLPDEILEICIRNLGDDNRELVMKTNIDELKPLFMELESR